MIFNDISSKEVITLGWSTDKKYYVTTRNGVHYLLRESSLVKADKRKQEFDEMLKVSSNGVSMCRPIAIRVSDKVEVLHEWIDGIDLYDVMDTYDLKTQYEQGRNAGVMLKQIHDIFIDDEYLFDWEKHFNQKIDKKILNYRECEEKYPEGNEFLRYLEEHRYLLKERPIVFQHGDYHIGNMMVNKDDEIVIIDFDRSDYGDPYEEFNRIVWSAEASPHFATGIIDGYFNDNIPLDFWELLKFYIVANVISTLPWGLATDPSQMDVYYKQATQVYKWYGDMNKKIPLWYKEI